LNENRVEHLQEFVKRGGTLILTLRTGVKDQFNALLPARPPGPLAELAGVEVEDYYALQTPVSVSGKLFDGTSKQWAERLKILDSKRTLPVAQFGNSNGWLDDQPAITVSSLIRGMVYYIGVYLDERSQQILMDHILSFIGMHPIKAPANIEIRKRISKTGEDIYIVINHGSTEQDVQLPWPVYEHLGQEEIHGAIKLPPYGIAIATKQARSAPETQV
jgi:beta-galactosidase